MTDWRDQLKHPVENVLFASVAILCAVGLEVLNHWLGEHIELSEPLKIGMHWLALFIFYADAIVICFVVSANGVKVIANTVRGKNE